MELRTERRLLQIIVALACIVPLAAGGMGVLAGPSMLKGVSPPLPTDLDSHFRYLSGLLLGTGIAFAACIPRIERKAALFGTLAAIVILGGLARLVSLVLIGPPGTGHIFGFAMELGVVPLLLLWQRRVARRCGTPAL